MSKILIAADSLGVLADLAEGLEAAGLEALACTSLAEARAALAEHAIAVAILGVELPDGDGIELLVKLRARPETAELPVLLIADEAEVGDRVRVLRRGADGYIRTPYDRGLVVARIGQLSRGGPSDLVLVIDDSAAFRTELERALAHAGFATASAPDGVEGLITAARLRPVALIVDAVMPGLDGPTTIRRLRFDPVLRATPCLMLTVAGEDAAPGEPDAGADAYLRRTDDVEHVVARLVAMLRGEPARAAASPPRPERILAVDDSPLFRDALGELLRKAGYEVALASSGEEAIEVLAGREVDCILLDCVMPGIGGIEACRRIKSAPMIGDVPLIMLTMLDGGDSTIEGLAAGADDYIAKSAGFEVINARIRSQLRRKQLEDEHRRVRERMLHGERAAAEAQAARALAANRELEALSHALSDGLREPLEGITGLARGLEDELGGSLAGPHLDRLRRIRTSAAGMGELLDLLLELARIEQAPLEIQPIDVDALVAALVPGPPAEGRRATVRVSPRLTMQADPRLARTLFQTLLSNARRLAPLEAEPVIEIGCSAERTYFVRASAADAELAGFGLAIARRIVERHGGRIWAEAGAGGSAAIHFTLP